MRLKSDLMPVCFITGSEKMTVKRAPSWKDDNDYWVADLEERHFPSQNPDNTRERAPPEAEDTKDSASGHVSIVESAEQKAGLATLISTQLDQMAQPPSYHDNEMSTMSEFSLEYRYGSQDLRESKPPLLPEDATERLTLSQLDATDWASEDAKGSEPETGVDNQRIGVFTFL